MGHVISDRLQGDHLELELNKYVNKWQITGARFLTARERNVQISKLELKTRKLEINLWC